MTWTAFLDAVLCGYDGAAIPAGEPVQLLGNGRLKRCQAHAHGDVDWAAVDAARHQHELNRAVVAPTPLANARPAYRHRPGGMRAIHEIGSDALFDPKALAAGGDQ